MFRPNRSLSSWHALHLASDRLGRAPARRLPAIAAEARTLDGVAPPCRLREEGRRRPAPGGSPPAPPLRSAMAARPGGRAHKQEHRNTSPADCRSARLPPEHRLPPVHAAPRAGAAGCAPDHPAPRQLAERAAEGSNPRLSSPARWKRSSSRTAGAHVALIRGPLRRNRPARRSAERNSGSTWRNHSDA